MSKLFTAEIDKVLFNQYKFGSDLAKQKVVAKIFNPYSKGTWYLLNSDPEDPDYIWAIVDLFEVEIGSVSREELINMKVPPFQLNLERDKFFQPMNAEELFTRLIGGEQFEAGGKMGCGCKHIEYEKGGGFGHNPSHFKKVMNEIGAHHDADIDDEMYAKGGKLKHDNKAMVEQQLTTIEHHAKELMQTLSHKTKNVEAWVVAKAQRAATDLSDVTHYLEGTKFAHGGQMHARGGGLSRSQKDYNKNVDAYKYFIVDLDKKMAVSGWEYRSDAVDALTDYDGDKNFKIVAESSLKSLGIENPKERFKKMAHGGMMAKGGVTYVGNYSIDEKSYYFRRFHNAIGSIAWVNDGKFIEAILFPLSEYDKDFYSHIKLKEGEHLLRYSTDRMMERKLQYLLKINVDNSLIYFMEDSEDDKNPIFKNRGIKAEYIIIETGKYAHGGYMADGGMMAKGGKFTFNDKVKAIEDRLEGTNVNPRYRSTYGSTYNKKEAHEAALKIVGSMRQKMMQHH